MKRFWVSVRGELTNESIELFLDFNQAKYEVAEHKYFTMGADSQKRPPSYMVGQISVYLFEKKSEDTN